jgi:hypothetical protein
MTESDVLARAARALRDAHTGEREGSGFTRARIMNTLHRERRRRTLRWAIFSPIASVLLVGSAWAQSSGKWPVIWRAVASVFVSAPVPQSAPAPSAQRPALDTPNPAPGELPPDPTSVDAGDDALAEPPALEHEGARPSAPVEAGRLAKKPLRRRARQTPPSSTATEPAPSAAPEAPAEPERERELGRFRRAHDLHFKGRAAEALDAYAQYLREYPQGRFAPEARYAMALDHIKVGDDAGAREALAPFAAGRYGGYRQKEAHTLLEALEKKHKRKKPAGR